MEVQNVEPPLTGSLVQQYLKRYALIAAVALLIIFFGSSTLAASWMPQALWSSDAVRAVVLSVLISISVYLNDMYLFSGN